MATAAVLVAIVIAAVFFFSFWGRNAEGVGAHDLGTGLGLSFAVPVFFYASVAWAALSAAGAAIAKARGRPATRWLVALAISLLPAAFFLLLDLRRPPSGL
jgi:hypothetical protein